MMSTFIVIVVCILFVLLLSKIPFWIHQYSSMKYKIEDLENDKKNLEVELYKHGRGDE